MNRFAHLTIVAILIFCATVTAGVRDELDSAKRLLDGKKYDEAISAYQKLIARYPGQRRYCGAAQYFIGLAFQESERFDEALEAYDKLVNDYEDINYFAVRGYSRRAQIFRWRKRDLRKALEEFSKAATLYPEQDMTATVLLETGKIYISQKDYPDAQKALESLLFTDAHPLKVCVDTKSLLLDCLMAQKKFAEALAAAKAYFNVCPLDAKSRSSAINKVAKCLKAAHGSLLEANTFLKFQKLGQAGEDGKLGTEDDMRNPLADVKVKISEEAKTTYQDELDKQPDDYKGHRNKGYIYLFLDEPTKAMSELKMAFLQSPLQEEAIQKAVDDIGVGLKAINGTFFGAEAFLEYQKYGKNGPDGKPGTEDDLTDPLADY